MKKAGIYNNNYPLTNGIRNFLAMILETKMRPLLLFIDENM